METNILQNKYDLKELELNSLLEITQAINNNLPEESLYKIYHFTLRANLNIKRLALYVLDEKWNCKVNFGTRNDFYYVQLEDDFLNYRTIKEIDKGSDTKFSEFDRLIPVAHKDKILAFVFVGGDNQRQKDDSFGINYTLIQALSNIIIVAIENKKMARRELRQEALRKELEIAKNVQSFLFPKNLPNNQTLQVRAHYLPHHTVGGDYYDFLQINPDCFLVCIADVSGKGIPAAILMSNFQASLHTLVRKTTDLKDIVNELNFQILKNANGENFITFFAGIYNAKSKTFQYINAGHNPPLFIHNNKMQLLEKGTTILGNFDPLPFLEEGKIEKADSFYFFAYTDGVTETFNDNDEEFGMERLLKIIRDNHQKDIKEIHDHLLSELNTFKGNRRTKDDITFISCRVP